MATEDIEALIWLYVDGTAGEQAVYIANMISTDAQWQHVYNEITEVHAMLQQMEADMPSMRFSKNVMEAIGQTVIAPATKEYINRYVVMAISCFMIISVVVLSVFAILHGGSNASYNVPYDLANDNKYLPALVGVNVLAGLVLIDRYLPLLLRRRGDV